VPSSPVVKDAGGGKGNGARVRRPVLTVRSKNNLSWEKTHETPQPKSGN